MWQPLAFVLTLLCVLPTVSMAREIPNIDAINRETRIVADVIKSSLRSEIDGQVRVTSVSGEYLAKQGVLISVRLNAPWLTIADGDSAIEINGHINLDEIPSMVENILADLQIEVSPYEPEALDELRNLREEQRELRSDQRKLRTKLRERRRALVRATEDDDREDVQVKIDDLERELLAVDAQYNALAKDIDIQYKELRDYRGGYKEPSEEISDTNYPLLMAKAACDYGSTLKSLSSENYLTFAVRRDENADFYAFKMDHIHSCNGGDMKVEKLLELAFQYSS